MRFRAILCFIAGWTGLATAQTVQTVQPGVFHELTTGLTMRYPVELVVRDTQNAIEEGHIAAFGSMQAEAKEHELASRCMKPILIAELPEKPKQVDATTGTATLFLFEFVNSKECRSEFKYKDDESVAGGIAQNGTELPGATSSAHRSGLTSANRSCISRSRLSDSKQIPMKRQVCLRSLLCVITDTFLVG